MSTESPLNAWTQQLADRVQLDASALIAAGWSSEDVLLIVLDAELARVGRAIEVGLRGGGLRPPPGGGDG